MMADTRLPPVRGHPATPRVVGIRTGLSRGCDVLKQIGDFLCGWDSSAIVTQKMDFLIWEDALDIFEHLPAVTFYDEDLLDVFCSVAQGIDGERP